MMRCALLLSVLLPLLVGSCGEKDPVAEVKAVEEQQQEVEPVDPNLRYQTEGDAVTITRCDREALGALTIPATIEGNPVTSIKEMAFNGCTGLTSITIPNHVTSIGVFAFAQCTSLTSIEVGAGSVNFTEVNGVLLNAEKTVLLTYPAGKTGANYNIPNGVTSIGGGAFAGCSSLTSITIPEGVTSIEEEAFFNCTRLASITIGESVTSIGDGAFNRCRYLTSISIPDSVTSIGNTAFYKCISLKSVTIPDSVTVIGQGAFVECRLRSITIPDSVTSIGYEAFSRCYNLTAVTFLGDAPKAGKEVFKDATPTIYRKPEAKGWGDTFGGRPVKLISEKP